MTTPYERLESLVAKSNRTVFERQWVDDELFAIKFLGASEGMLRLYDSGLKYTNNDQSSVAYLIGITDYQPIKPAAIISTARIEPPDIDLDFEDKRRGEIKEYLSKKWKNLVSITTFNKFSSRGLVRDLSRVFAVPLSEVNKVCKQFTTIEEFETSQECRWFRVKYPEILKLAKDFEGRWRAAGVHAAGVVLADRPLVDIIPLESRSIPKSETRLPVTAYDMEDIQAIGLVKLDVLGIAALTVISDCLKEVERRHGVKINLDTLDYKDEEVYKNFSSGKTIGVFQAEAAPYTNLLLRMSAESFKDLVVSNALVRPGPLLTVGQEYIARKKGEKPVPEEHPKIEEITKDTYNLFIFQEQLIEALVKIGGFSWPEADYVRKIIGKKRDIEEFRKYEEKWVKNAAEVIGLSKCRKLWSDFEKFSGYAFNKAHATAYSILSYQTMWLKTKYPMEYMWALLKNESEQNKVSTLLIECQRLGIEVRKPTIEDSEEVFSLHGEGEDCYIRFGFKNIKGVGDGAAEELIKCRPFKDMDDLLERTQRKKVTTKTIGLLDKLGLLDYLGHESEFTPKEHEFELLGIVSDILEAPPEVKLDITPLNEFQKERSTLIRGFVKDIRKFPKYSRVELEDSTGIRQFYIDNLELEKGRVIIAVASFSSITTFTYEEDFVERIKNDYALSPFEKYLRGEVLKGEKVLYNHGIGKIGDEKALVVPIGNRVFTTKRNQVMSRMIVADGEGNTEDVIVFPSTYKRFGSKIKTFVPIIIKTKTLDDGGECLEDMITARDLMMMKGLT